jgi:hypothetical protein
VIFLFMEEKNDKIAFERETTLMSDNMALYGYIPSWQCFWFVLLNFYNLALGSKKYFIGQVLLFG